jgi:hypothetical protein
MGGTRTPSPLAMLRLPCDSITIPRDAIKVKVVFNATIRISVLSADLITITRPWITTVTIT